MFNIKINWYQMIPFLYILNIRRWELCVTKYRRKMLLQQEHVRAFLLEVKKLVSRGKRTFIRRKGYKKPNGETFNYLEALHDIGLTEISQAWDEVRTLKPQHYIKGPCIDRDRPQEGKVLWIFKKEVNDVTTYIKLKINTAEGCVCLSFHRDW